VALAGGGVTLAGLIFALPPVLLPGVGLLLLASASATWSALAARGVGVERRLSAAAVLEGEPLRATIEIRHGRLGLPAAEVHDPLSSEPLPVRRSLSSRAGGRSRIPTTVSFARRGRELLEPPALLIRDPLELACAVCHGARGQEVLVLPRTEPLRWLGSEDGEQPGSRPRHAVLERGATAELDGLGPYRPGTPAARIHWPALARGAGLQERRLRAERDHRPLIVLDARMPGSDEDLDAAVRAAASLTLELARRGGCDLLLPGSRRPLRVEPDLRAWRQAHTRLALVQAADASRSPALARGAAARELFYVAAASPAPGAPLAGALVTFGDRATVLVLPVGVTDAIAYPPHFEVAGCRGFALGAGRRRPAGSHAA